jgi:hypothetical protein
VFPQNFEREHRPEGEQATAASPERKAFGRPAAQERYEPTSGTRAGQRTVKG